MLKDVSVQQALSYKNQLKAIDGILSVTWLDDIVGLDTWGTTPLAYLDSAIQRPTIRANNALIYITVETAARKRTIKAVYDLIGENNSVSGDAVNTAYWLRKCPLQKLQRLL
jgi:hypothetical protein